MKFKISCRLGVVWLSAMACALAQDPTKVAPKQYRLDFENDRVQVVHITYGPHAKSVMHDHPGGVVVNITDGHLRFTDPEGKTREVAAKRGEARWFPPLKHRVENLTDTTYEAVYVGIKGMTASSAGLDLNGLSESDRKIVAAFLPNMQHEEPQHSSDGLGKKPAVSRLGAPVGATNTCSPVNMRPVWCSGWR